jgi:hypothetical protein
VRSEIGRGRGGEGTGRWEEGSEGVGKVEEGSGRCKR